MAETTEIPQLATELFDMSKGYLEEQAVEPLKRTGRYAGFSLGAGVLFALGWLFLSIAGLRVLQDVLPDTELFSVLAYVLTALASLAVAGLLMWRASKAEGIK